ncbi:MAG: nitrate/nitrite transporter NrtS [Chloroflexi bacterium]|nr:nitrate/nitrite transporter NrtS [Chloroflexota bacterium]
MVRSLTVTALIGTLLIAINHGNVIVEGNVPDSLVWKVPLTYSVPYCVATFGAIMNARRQTVGE